MRLAPTVFVSGADETADLLQVLRHAGFVNCTATRVTFTVLDTLDGRLHRSGLRLVATAAETITLALSDADHSYGTIATSAPPIRASEIPGGPLRDAVMAAIGERLLLARATVVAARTVASLHNSSGELRSQVTVDENLHLAGRRKELASMTTVHRVAGKGKVRRRAEALCADAGLTVNREDALSEILNRAGVDLSGVVRGRAELDGAASALIGFREVLHDLFVAVDAYWRGAAESRDPAFVFGLRVASRRSRSVLVEGKTVLPREALTIASAGLGAVGACTGPARDLDVYLDGWDSYLSALPVETAAALGPVKALLESQRDAAYREVALGLRAPQMKAFVRDWSRWLRKPVSNKSLTRSPDHGRELRPFIVERIESAQLILLENGRLITDGSPATQVHDLRRDAKRLRYLLECFSGLLPTKATKQFVRRLKSLQDNLGAHQDAEVHASRLGDLLGHPDAAEFPTATLAAANDLVRYLEQQCQLARREFSVRFAEYDSPATQAALARILAVSLPVSLLVSLPVSLPVPLPVPLKDSASIV